MQLEGQQVGHYRLLSLIGSGGMGAVYLAEDLSVKRQVAIKVIRTESFLNPEDDVAKEAAHLFRREANAVAMLDHPNILPLFDYGEENLLGEKMTYMVMPFRQEGSLADWLRKTDGSHWLTAQNVAFLIHQAASALQYAHDHQIIHRDVKPSNFLIRGRSESPSQPDLLLADFGIAKFSAAVSSTETMTRGTPIYMAPEQWQDHPVPATDQYALAVMTYELLTSRPPFQGNHSQLMYQHFHAQPSPLSSINPRLSTGIDEVMLRALAKTPNDRFPTIATFDQAFQQAVSNIKKIQVTVNINHMEAINGTHRTITLPDGRVVTVTVPPGAYDGQIIQLDDRGVASSDGDLVGNLIITITISRVEKTVVALQNSKTIENTLPDPNMSQNQMPNNQRRGSSIGKILILLIVLLLLAGSVGLFFYGQITANQVYITQTATAQSKLTTIAQNTMAAQVNATETAQAQANATETAVAQETATAVAAVTATSVAEASATAGPILTATSSQPLYQDTLKNASSANTVAEGWDQNTNCIFAPNGYHEKEDSNWHICGEAANTYQNVAVTVKMDILSGQTGGLLFRASPTLFDQYNGYLFELDSAGRYRISRVSTGINVPALTHLKDWASSSALSQGSTASNTLQVIAQGVTLSFYANGVFLDQETDSNYSSGDIAFYVTSDGHAMADVVYSDLNVYPLS